jgi:hypothetical protein
MPFICPNDWEAPTEFICKQCHQKKTDDHGVYMDGGLYSSINDILEDFDPNDEDEMAWLVQITTKEMTCVDCQTKLEEEADAAMVKCEEAMDKAEVAAIVEAWQAAVARNPDLKFCFCLEGTEMDQGISRLEEEANAAVVKCEESVSVVTIGKLQQGEVFLLFDNNNQRKGKDR